MRARSTPLLALAPLALLVACGGERRSSGGAGVAAAASGPWTPVGSADQGGDPLAALPANDVAAPVALPAAGGTATTPPAVQAGSASAGTGAGAPAASPLAPEPDQDGDGLPDADEVLLGTDPRRPDSDGDGIVDGRDLMPTAGATAYGKFQPKHPRGAVRVPVEFTALALEGRSKVETWLLGWKTSAQGTSGTRHSETTRAAVLDELKEQLAGGDFQAGKATPLGPAREVGTYTKRQQILHKRYTIDYTFQARPFQVELKNRHAVALEDARGKVFAARTLPIAVRGGHASTLVLQVSVAPGADRAEESGARPVLPAIWFQVLGGDDPTSAPLLVSDLALASELNRHAYEARIPLPVLKGTGLETWTVVASPVWVLPRGDDTALEAIDAAQVRLGAVAHEQEALRSAGRVSSITWVPAGVGGLTDDLRDLVAGAAFSRPVVREQRVIQADGEFVPEWTVSTVKTAGKVALGTSGFLRTVDQATQIVRGKRLMDLLEREDAERYGAFTGLLERNGQRAMAVINAYAAVVSLREGDALDATLYGARSARDGFRSLGKTRVLRKPLVRGASAAAEAALAIRGAYQAFQEGDVALGVFHVTRGSAATALQLFRDAKPGGVPLGPVLQTAISLTDVGLSLWRAKQARDPLLRQAFVEAAVGAALDAAITLIPGVGAPLEAIWQGAWAVATLIFPKLAKWRMLSSPGALLTFAGTVIFTHAIPSAIAEDAYTNAVRALARKAKAREDRGERPLVLLPKVA